MVENKYLTDLFRQYVRENIDWFASTANNEDSMMFDELKFDSADYLY